MSNVSQFLNQIKNQKTKNYHVGNNRMEKIYSIVSNKTPLVSTLNTRGYGYNGKTVIVYSRYGYILKISIVTTSRVVDYVNKEIVIFG